MRCAVCYHGRAELYVCDDCAAGAAMWDERFGDDDAVPASLSRRVRSQQRIDMLGIEQEHHLALMSDPIGSPNHDQRARHWSVTFTAAEKRQFSEACILPHWHWAYQRQQAMRVLRIRRFWKRFPEVWARIGLQAFTDRISIKPPARRIPREILERIEAQEPQERRKSALPRPKQKRPRAATPQERRKTRPRISDALERIEAFERAQVAE
jgi:hypothetical protein